MIFNDFKKDSLPKHIIFPGLVVFGMSGLLLPFEVSAEKNFSAVNWSTSLCRPANFRSLGKSAAQMEAERQAARIARAKAEAERRANAWPTEFVKITKNMKNPNKVKIPFAQAPGISADTREENGRRVCEHKKDKGNKSKQKGKDVHIDKECCLDPDEIPNPRCYYPKLGADNSPERVVGTDGKKRIK